MKQIYVYLKKQFLFFQRFQVPLYAANSAFYIILSVFPGIMLVVGLLPYLGFSQADLLEAMGGLVPSVFEPLIARILADMSQNSTRALISITALLAIWSSSRGIYCIQVGLNSIYQVKENRNYFYRRAISMVYTVLMIAALMLTLILQGFGRELAGLLQNQKIPVFDFIVKILDFRELVILLLLSCLFAGIFCALPNRKQRFFSVLPGAFLAALGWLVFTYGFSIYAKFSGSGSPLYGSLSIIAMGMLWLYVCICILFYGCVFNLWLAKRKK